ncbi:hypothetical protein ACQ3G6_15060 [Allorhizobium undicola]|uniref:hypothetical protein n=1 Tax=Allorhizobium undicola TaxID=78527 RepID=UPI003D330CB7
MASTVAMYFAIASMPGRTIIAAAISIMPRKTGWGGLGAVIGQGPFETGCNLSIGYGFAEYRNVPGPRKIMIGPEEGKFGKVTTICPRCEGYFPRPSPATAQLFHLGRKLRKVIPYKNYRNSYSETIARKGNRKPGRRHIRIHRGTAS